MSNIHDDLFYQHNEKRVQTENTVLLNGCTRIPPTMIYSEKDHRNQNQPQKHSTESKASRLRSPHLDATGRASLRRERVSKSSVTVVLVTIVYRDGVWKGKFVIPACVSSWAAVPGSCSMQERTGHTAERHSCLQTISRQTCMSINLTAKHTGRADEKQDRANGATSGAGNGKKPTITTGRAPAAARPQITALHLHAKEKRPERE